MRPCTKHITTKYHQLWSFFVKINILIKHVDTKEHISDILTKILDPDLFGYIYHRINGCQETVSFFSMESNITCMGQVYYNIWQKWVNKNLIWRARDQHRNLIYNIISRPKVTQAHKILLIKLSQARAESLQNSIKSNWAGFSVFLLELIVLISRFSNNYK